MEEGELGSDDVRSDNTPSLRIGKLKPLQILITMFCIATRSSKAVSPSPSSSGKANLLARKKWSGCLHLDDFKLEEKLGEGTFGVVFKAVHRRTKQVVALKKILTRPEQEGFPITALREIKLLKLVKHPNCMSITDLAVSSSIKNISSFLLIIER